MTKDDLDIVTAKVKALWATMATNLPQSDFDDVLSDVLFDIARTPHVECYEAFAHRATLYSILDAARRRSRNKTALRSIEEEKP